MANVFNIKEIIQIMKEKNGNIFVINPVEDFEKEGQIIDGILHIKRGKKMIGINLVNNYIIDKDLFTEPVKKISKIKILSENEPPTSNLH